MKIIFLCLFFVSSAIKQPQEQNKLVTKDSNHAEGPSLSDDLVETTNPTESDLHPDAALDRIRQIRQFLQNAMTAEQLKEVESQLKEPLEKMERTALIKLLEKIYQLEGVPLVSQSVKDFDDEKIRQRIRDEVKDLMLNEEGTLALENLEASDSPVSKRSVVAMTVPKGRTGAIVYLFNLLLKKIYGYDLLEKAAEEAYKERLKTQTSLELGIDRDKLDPKLVDDILKKKKDKERPFTNRGKIFNPYMNQLL